MEKGSNPQYFLVQFLAYCRELYYRLPPHIANRRNIRFWKKAISINCACTTCILKIHYTLFGKYVLDGAHFIHLHKQTVLLFSFQGYCVEPKHRMNSQ